MQKALLELLQYGFNPYEDNSALKAHVFSRENQIINKTTTKQQQDVTAKKVVDNQIEEPSISIEEAFKLTLDLKVNMMNKNSFIQYKSRIGLFEKWLKKRIVLINQ